MTRDEKNFRIWFAGFFDGEGSIGIYKWPHNRGNGAVRWEPRLVVYQKEPGIIEEIHRRFGGSIHRTGQNRDVLAVVWLGRKAVEIARYLQPYLRVKHTQCEVFLDAMRQWGRYNRNGRGNILSPELVALREMLANSVNAFNHQYKRRQHRAKSRLPNRETCDGRTPAPLREETT